eukprot:scaffold14196_cov104-Isochrysis_galbana.AAC.2
MADAPWGDKVELEHFHYCSSSRGHGGGGGSALGIATHYKQMSTIFYGREIQHSMLNTLEPTRRPINGSNTTRPRLPPRGERRLEWASSIGTATSKLCKSNGY